MNDRVRFATLLLLICSLGLLLGATLASGQSDTPGTDTVPSGTAPSDTVPSNTAEPVARLDLVDRAIEHHGGERYRSTETTLDVCSKSGCFAVRARVEGDAFDFTVQGTVRAGERRVRVTNDLVERWRDGEAVPVATEDEAALRNWVMARVYFPFLPFRLNDPSVWKQDLGLETWDGRSLQRVKVTFTAGSSSDADDEYTYWLDPGTGQVIQFAYSYKGETDGLRFRRAVRFRRLGGILFFDQENLGAEGNGLSVDDITPEFVRTLEHVSTVELRNIVVRGLDPTP